MSGTAGIPAVNGRGEVKRIATPGAVGRFLDFLPAVHGREEVNTGTRPHRPQAPAALVIRSPQHAPD